jgi:hypothetical protein
MRPFRVLQLGVGPRAAPALQLGVVRVPRPAVMRAGHRSRRAIDAFRTEGMLKVGNHTIAQNRAIDRFLFQPLNIRAQRNESSAYRFYAQADFDSLVVEFVKLERNPDGLSHQVVNEQFIEDGVRREQWIGRDEERTWDGRDKEEIVSRGGHKLQVRAWDSEGDWTLAWSESLLMVTD